MSYTKRQDVGQVLPTIHAFYESTFRLAHKRPQ